MEPSGLEVDHDTEFVLREARRARYEAAHEKVRWIDIVTTDFNRPPRLTDEGNLDYFARAFSYEDGTGSVEVGQTVFLSAGGGEDEGCPGILVKVTKVLDEVHATKQSIGWGGGADWIDYHRYVHVSPIEWSEA